MDTQKLSSVIDRTLCKTETPFLLGSMIKWVETSFFPKIFGEKLEESLPAGTLLWKKNSNALSIRKPSQPRNG